MRFRADNESEKRNRADDGTQRIEAFSDGVFSIAITLLILDVKIPHLAGTGQSLARALLTLWPAYLTYILTFVTVGIYWANHNYIFRLYQKSNHIFNLLNVVFLMCVSFMPLPAATLGEYVLSPTHRQAAVIFYTVGLLLPGLAWLLVWLYASHNYRLIDSRLTPQYVRHMTRQYILSTVLYLLALLASLWNPMVGLSVAAGLTLLYLLPQKPPEYKSSEELGARSDE